MESKNILSWKGHIIKSSSLFHTGPLKIQALRLRALHKHLSSDRVVIWRSGQIALDHPSNLDRSLSTHLPAFKFQNLIPEVWGHLCGWSMQEMDLLAALSRNLLPFPRLLGPLLLPGGRGQEILYIFIVAGWHIHIKDGRAWFCQSVSSSNSPLLLSLVASSWSCLLSSWAALLPGLRSHRCAHCCWQKIWAHPKTRGLGDYLFSQENSLDSYVSSCGWRGQRGLRGHGFLPGEYHDRNSLQIGDKYCWKQHSDRAFPLHSHAPAVAPDPGCPL